MKTPISFIALLISLQVSAQEVQLITTETPTEASFRGLSVVDDSVVWLSGSKGWVGRSINGGKDWRFLQVVGYEAYDFRSLYAFDAQKAIIANAGSPAHVLLTTDGGITWNLVYKNENPEAFPDGMDFWNQQEGLIYGDPIRQRMMILRTQDGGQSWEELSAQQEPLLEQGEASFAASGTNIRSFAGGSVAIATGGKVSRLWFSKDQGHNWQSVTTPIIQGEAATGIFSFAFWDQNRGIIVGGDYTQDTLKTKHVFLTFDGGQTWEAPTKPTGGYRSCVEYLDQASLLACGTSGVDLSLDGGKNWKTISPEAYHVVRKARTGKLVVLAGGKGKVAILKH